MKRFQIFRYLKRILPLVLILCMGLTVLVYTKLSASNTYVASEVIHYNDPLAEEGKAPTGEKLDVNEIRSSAVLSKVLDRMGLAGTYSVDSLISRFTITPVPDEDKLAQKAAKLEEGEEYVYEPSTFVVSFAATNQEGRGFASAVLDETLDVYFSQFSSHYVNVAPVNNAVEKLSEGNYDYIEMLEIIDESLTETLDTLYQRAERTPYYRASATGLSFNDLADDFNYLAQKDVASLFSKVYKNQITKDKSVLLSDYRTRIDNNAITGEKEKKLVEDILVVVEAYVQKMRDSGNTNITYEYILDNLHERDLTAAGWGGDQTVTYDELIYGWRNHNESREYAVIDTAYCNYVIDTFGGCCSETCASACALSGKTCTELNDGEYEKKRGEVETELNALLSELSRLHALTMETNNEYNEYLGASYISVLSTASVKASVNVKLYTAIAFVFLVVVCCGCVAVLGRVGDIISYVFYTDHLTGFRNRAWLDHFFRSMEKKLLDDGVVYCAVDFVGLSRINDQHTRAVGDAVLKYFSAELKESFGKSPGEFIYNGNGSFVILLERSDYITAEDILRLFRLRLDEREEFTEIPFSFKIGIAETFRNQQSARKLLAEAIRKRQSYASPEEAAEE